MSLANHSRQNECAPQESHGCTDDVLSVPLHPPLADRPGHVGQNTRGEGSQLQGGGHGHRNTSGGSPIRPHTPPTTKKKRHERKLCTAPRQCVKLYRCSLCSCSHCRLSFQEPGRHFTGRHPCSIQQNRPTVTRCRDPSLAMCFGLFPPARFHKCCPVWGSTCPFLCLAPVASAPV